MTEKKLKAAAFDLDGTLIARGDMSQEIINTMTRLKESDIISIVATGRDWCQVPSYMRKLFDYGISTSGGCIRSCDDEKVLFQSPIPGKDILKVIEVLDHFHSGYFLYLEGSAECTGNAFTQINKNNPRIDREIFLESFNTREHASHSLYEFEKETEKTVFKIEAYFSSKKDSLLAKEELEKVAPLKVVVMNHDSLEINYVDITKASALKHLGKIIGIDREELVAFGDSRNDLDMLDYAGLAVVMDNAGDDIKAHANIIAPNVFEDGAATVIKELFNV